MPASPWSCFGCAALLSIPGSTFVELTGENHFPWLGDVASLTTAIERFLHDQNYPGFASGTMGQFLDFGAWTNVRLHGKEKVVTEAEGRAEALAAPARLE